MFLKRKRKVFLLAWLEKQGQQKPTQETEPTPIFRIGDVLKRKGRDYTFRVDRIQGGYYHCDRNHGAFFPIEEQDNWELVEQKPAEWSEEDDSKLKEVLYYIEYVNKTNVTFQQRDLVHLINWLKSLKERYSWKPSDEQMEALKYSTYCPNEQMSKVLFELYQDLKKLREE